MFGGARHYMFPDPGRPGIEYFVKTLLQAQVCRVMPAVYDGDVFFGESFCNKLLQDSRTRRRF